MQQSQIPPSSITNLYDGSAYDSPTYDTSVETPTSGATDPDTMGQNTGMQGSQGTHASHASHRHHSMFQSLGMGGKVGGQGIQGLHSGGQGTHSLPDVLQAGKGHGHGLDMGGKGQVLQAGNRGQGLQGSGQGVQMPAVAQPDYSLLTPDAMPMPATMSAIQ